MKKEFENVHNGNTPFTNEQYTAEPTTAVAITMDNNKNFVADLTSRQTSFCSLKAESAQEKALLFKAMNNPDKRLSDCINMTINAKDIYCEVVTCINQITGEEQICPRIVIIDDKRVGYQAVSLGIYSAVKKIFSVFGTPTWTTPLPLTVKQITKGERKLLTFDVDFK